MAVEISRSIPGLGDQTLTGRKKKGTANGRPFFSSLSPLATTFRSARLRHASLAGPSKRRTFCIHVACRRRDLASNDPLTASAVGWDSLAVRHPHVLYLRRLAQKFAALTGTNVEPVAVVPRSPCGLPVRGGREPRASSALSRPKVPN